MLKVSKLKFSFPDQKPVLKGLSLKLKPGEILAIVGETGAGKTTLLKCLAGFYAIDSGSIMLDNEEVLGPDRNLIPGHPEIKHVAQDFNLLPNHTIEENISSELKQYFKYQKNEIVKSVLTQLNIWKIRKSIPRLLSGGQQQRVALAKALAEQPRLLLLDEPFNQQDSWNKAEVLLAIKELAKTFNIGIILVTHQYEDALHLSDRVCAMGNGKIIQIGTPEELFFNPKNEYVAKLFGDFIMVKDQLVRPIQLQISKKKTDLICEVTGCKFKGSYYELDVLLDEKKIKLVSTEKVENGACYLKILSK